MKQEGIQSKIKVITRQQAKGMEFTIDINCKPLTLNMQQRETQYSEISKIANLSYELKSCYFLMKEIEKHQFSFFFKWPVDPYKLKLKNYWQIIKKPMDLKTIFYKLLQKFYKTIEQFNNDLELMFNNNLTYHHQDQFLLCKINTFHSFYRQKFKRTLEEAKLQRSRVPDKEYIRHAPIVNKPLGRRYKIMPSNQAHLKQFFTKQQITKLGKILCCLNDSKKKWIVIQLLRKYPHLSFSQGKFQLQQLNTMELYDLVVMTGKFKRSDYDFSKMLDKPRLSDEQDAQQQKKSVPLGKNPGSISQQQQSSFEVQDSD